jgi:ribosomal-protein-alanine N-acetyltransferase
MKYIFKPMSKEVAITVSTWQYDEPYSIYNMSSSNEGIEELMNGEYYLALDEKAKVFGYLCQGNSARVPGGYVSGIYENGDYLDIGFGLHPDSTGKGLGYSYINRCMEFIDNMSGKKKYRLVVASFNARAIKVYERAGFIKKNHFKSRVDHKSINFIEMIKDV